jgi:type IV secretion system protein VirD4
MAGSIFAYIAMGVAGILQFGLAVWRSEGKKPSSHGSADWSTVWPLYKKGLFDRKGLMVGDWSGLLSVHYDGTHAISFGTTGSGKGVAAVLPNLLSYPYVFLLDPGGENSAIASKHWRAAGYEFRCINFFGKHTDAPWELPTHGFNPLDTLDAGSPTFEADALVIAELLIKRDGTETGSTVFFKEAAKDHIRDFIVHCKTTEPKARQNLATIFRYLNSAPEEWTRLLRAMKANGTCEGLVRTGALAIERREAQALEEHSAIMSTMQEDLNWLTDPRVRRFIGRSDVDFSILKGLLPGQKGGIISVVLPLEYNKTHAAISRLALACAVITMQRDPLSKRKAIFLIDEAADLGSITRLPDWLATLRKYRVVFWPIFQNIGQVAGLYGRAWQTVIANCGLLQILSVGNDLETAKHAEALLGRATVSTFSRNGRGEQSRSEAGRSLLTGDELRRLREDEQIVLIGNLPPMKLRKTPYWSRPELSGHFHPNPYWDGKALRAGARGALRALWGRVYYGFVWWMAPHPIAALIQLSALSAFLYWLFG